MLHWCLAHPWMTFFTVCFLAYVVDNIVVNICKIINNSLKVKYAGMIIENENQEEEE